RPFYPAKYDRLAIFRLHGALEIGHFTGGHVDAPAVHDAQRPFLPEKSGGPGRMVDETLAVAVRDTRNHAVDIAELAALTGVERRLEPGIDHPLAVERHRTIGLHSIVGHEFPRRRVARRLVGPPDPRKDHCLIIVRADGLLEVGDLANHHVVAPAFD